VPVDRNQLAAALRAWRARVRPEDAGVAHRGARRTPGLRRDEVAMLAGVSVEYVIRLEQGRARNPSRQVLDALARALRLSSPEREHLLRLAGMTPPVAGELPRAVPPSVQRLLQRLEDVPVAVFDATWTLLSWNRMWAALFGEPRPPARSRNLVWQLFTVPAQTSRLVRTDEERQAFAATVVADLRTAAGRYPADAALQALVADLRRISDRFTALWASHAVESPTSSRKTVDHPEVGRMTLDCDVLAVAGHDLRVVVYTAEPGTAEADALALLRVVGTEAFSP
jgi:transcriptional regulator with XRE-family HTH domain